MTDRLSDPPYAEAILETITQPLLILTEDLRIETANRAFFRQFRTGAEETLGHCLYELGNRQWDIPELRRLLAEVLSRNHQIEEYRVEQVFQNLGERIMLLNASRVRQENAPARILLAISDITERERWAVEIEGRKEFAEKLIDSLRESLLVLHWDLRVQSANQSFYDTFQVKEEETVGNLIYELGNGQWDIPKLRHLLEQVLPHETSFDGFEVEHNFETLGRRVMLLNARRLDHLNLILLIIRDVTGERHADEQQKALMGELQHRVKNILNNVHALAIQTRRNSHSLEEFFEAFEARIGALARVQDLIAGGPSESVSLHDIIRLELEAMGAVEGKGFTIEGLTVLLSPHQVQAVAMTIHELTTNAAKYGALAAEGGRIEVTWNIERRDGREHLEFCWRERGVRIENTDPPKGFGTWVIEKSLPHMLGGLSELALRPEGVTCRLEFPLPE